MDEQSATDEQKSQESPEGAAPGYGNGPGYWNARYEKDVEPFEWLETYADLHGMVEEATGGSHSSRVLHIGCGNSTWTEQMYDAGYQEILNIDTSDVVIRQMISRNKDRPGMIFEEMDATKMTIEDNSFDLALDKSVLDTFACTDSAMLTIATYLKEVTRVLRPGGVFLCISYGAPDTRTVFFQLPHLDWSYRQVEIPPKQAGGGTHWAYICHLNETPGGGGVIPWAELEKSLKSPMPSCHACHRPLRQAAERLRPEPRLCDPCFGQRTA
mmetsp:Transcript_132041/g.232553  ORF Transcript_132041/g.232553 Transcript_132041/m.232553 type:complete len:270 (-) Transcript_132041:64-873(-)